MISAGRTGVFTIMTSMVSSGGSLILFTKVSTVGSALTVGTATSAREVVATGAAVGTGTVATGSGGRGWEHPSISNSSPKKASPSNLVCIAITSL